MSPTFTIYFNAVVSILLFSVMYISGTICALVAIHLTNRKD